MLRTSSPRAVSSPFSLSPFGLYLVAGLSGFAGLGYELTWTHVLGLALGHEIVATLCVLMGFFGGIALGSFLLGSRIGRSQAPGRWYAGLEAAIALWALAQIPLLPRVGFVVPALLGPDPTAAAHAAVMFGASFLVLLPATFAMGATLPALVAMLRAIRPERVSVGAVYAANTLGAFAGTWLSTFLIVPALGFSATLGLLAGVNALCAAAAWAGGPQRPLRAAESDPAAEVPPSSAPSHGEPRRLFAILFATGLLGIGYEVLVIRVLSQLLEDTVYTFAVLLAVYLFGTALGGALHARVSRKRPFSEHPSHPSPQRPSPEHPFPQRAERNIPNGLLAATAAACLFGTAILFAGPELLAWSRDRIAGSVAGGIAAETLLGAAVFLAPTIAMGALFSHLGQAFAARPEGLGRAVGWNTLGAAAAPVLFGLILLPALGAKTCLAAVSLGYVALTRPSGRAAWAAAAAPALVAGALLLSPAQLRFTHVPEGGLLVEQADGVMAGVAVIQDRGGERRLQVNSHFRMGGTATVRLDRRQAYLPLLLHPDPRTALFLGLGTGTTVAAAADYPGLATDGVELVPEIVPMLRHFRKSAGDLADRPGLRLHVADARRFVRASATAYDVIVADLYHPSLDGSGSLYTVEHFVAIRGRLAAGGVFCQWLPLHQLDLPTARAIVRAFLAAFPRGTAYLANFGLETPLLALVGQDDPARYAPGWFDRHAAAGTARQELAAVGFADDLGVLGLFLAGAGDLARFAGPGALNTDDRPVVATMAAGLVYAVSDTPGERLMSLIARFRPEPSQVLAPQVSSRSDDLSGRLAAYWRARDRFLAVGQAALAGARPLEAVAPDLLAILTISPDFDPAYFPLLAMARALAVRDPGGARKLLTALVRATPDRPEAPRLLERLR